MSKHTSIALLLGHFALGAMNLAPAQCGGCNKASASCGAEGGGLAGLRLVSLAGDTVAFADHIGNTPLVIFLSGTDSASGRAARVVQTVYAAADTAGPEFMAIVMAAAKPTKSFVRKNGLTLQVLMDPEHQSMSGFDTDAMPSVVFVDRSGKVVQTETMITEETVAEGLKAMRGPDEFIDPVCKMTVTKEGAAATYEYKGETYYFCNKACKDSFAKNPQKYLSQ